MKNDVEIYADDIDLYLQEYMDSRDVEDGRKMSSSMWAAAMMYIHDHVFKNAETLRIGHGYGDSPYEYDLDKVLALVDKYCFLCSDYDKRICTDHFSLLSGIDRTTIFLWGNGGRRSNDARAKQVYVKLMQGSMMAADDMMVSKNGVNSIAYRNATEQRYNQYMSRQEDRAAIDTTDLAQQLGLSADDLALLPEPETRTEVSKKPWESEEFLEGIEIL